MSYSFVTLIDENQCIGDSLSSINGNYANLDMGLVSLSGQYTTLKIKYNTLVQTLTSIGAPDTTYESLSTTLQTLSSLVLH